MSFSSMRIRPGPRYTIACILVPPPGCYASCGTTAHSEIEGGVLQRPCQRRCSETVRAAVAVPDSSSARDRSGEWCRVRRVEHRSNLAPERLGCEGFRKKCNAGPQHAVLDDRVF